jgi:Flp pilus assembly protein TadG
MTRGRRGSTHDRERGVSAVEFAILTPSLLILIFLLIQAGLYYHAVNVTQAVAQTTARVVRTYPGAPGQAPETRVPSGTELEPQANRVAVQTWQDLDANKTSERPTAAVQVDVGGYNQVTVTIRSRAVNLLPGIFPSLPVTAKASGPIEIFKPERTN